MFELDFNYYLLLFDIISYRIRSDEEGRKEGLNDNNNNDY